MPHEQGTAQTSALSDADAARCLRRHVLSDEVLPAADLEAQQAALEAAAARPDALLALTDAAAAPKKGPAFFTPFGRRAFRSGFERLITAIDAKWAGWRNHRSASAPQARLTEIPADLAAYVTLRAAVDGAAQRASATKVAQSIGGMLEDELRYRTAREAAPGLLKALAASAARLGGYAAKRAVLERGLAAAGVAPKPIWDGRDKELIGLRLLDLAIGALRLFELEADPQGPHRLVFTEHALAGRARLSAIAAALRPAREPMVSSPRPWTGPRGGGYLTAAPGLSLVKSMRPEHELRLLDAQMPVAYAALNAAQATAWSINDDVLQVMLRLDKDGSAWSGLPPARPASRPKSPEARRIWAAGERARRSRRIQHEAMIATARRFRRFERIFLPCQLDFRGRLYAVPPFNPQGPDAMRALFRFADGKPLGAEGWKWLAIHLANCGDFERISKAPLSARVAWTLRHEERILAAAADPQAERWWREADAPWQFLAACFEWARYAEEGESFASRLPIALDGSCSGIQHYSLALRDEVAGSAVNLTASDKSADIYAEVAAQARTLLEQAAAAAERGEGEDPARDAALANGWLAFGVDRSVCKRPTMTYGYGARAYGYANQILQDTLQPARAARSDAWPWPEEVSDFAAARFLAARLTEAIERVVLGAAQAMRWLQEVASISAREGVALTWTTPDGFPARQAYPKERTRRVKTTIAGSAHRFNLREDDGRLDPRRQRQGVAPNFVHALDACHLRLTVARASEEGMRHFQLVHDSFGVHAADTPRFFQIIRESLVEIYDEFDVLASFRDEIAAQLPPSAQAKLPEPPDGGDLDIREVLDSEFCFS